MNPNSSPMSDPEHRRNLVLAVLLSAVFMIAWQLLVLEPEREAAQAARAEKMAQIKAQAEEQQREAAAAQFEPLDGASNPHNATMPWNQTNRAKQAPLTPAPRITINTPRLHGSLSLEGLRLDDVTLADYRETLDEQSSEVALLHKSSSQHAYFAEFGWVDAGGHGIVLPTKRTRWELVSGEELTPETPLTFVWNNGQGLRFVRTIAVDEDYLFTVTQEVQNRTAQTLSLAPYALVNRQYVDQGQEYFVLHEGPIAVQNEVLEEVSYETLRDDEVVQFSTDKGWIGMTDKYWLTALLPDVKGTSEQHTLRLNHYTKNGADRYQADLLSGAKELMAGGSIKTKTHFFAGAKEVKLLDQYSAEYDAPLFDRAVDFGMLYFLTRPFFEALQYFHSLVGNFGLAIMCLTVCVKLVLFPLANKSYKAMGQMKVLMPKIQELRERHKDDKMAMNQEMMKLYQQEKVNPMSGCLPILVQIPIFFALYKVLFVSIEMRHAPFFGWIQDLSAPDPTSLFNLFGLIPFDPPSFLVIGVWPVVMCITMILQQKLNPKPADEMQAKVMAMLPYLFLFLFASFPAGLVIYWAWNNTLSITQQWIIMRRHGRH